MNCCPRPSALGYSSSGHPQYLGGDSFDCCAERYEKVVYCDTVYERSGKNMFWSKKNSGAVLSKLKDRGFQATRLSTYDFSTLYIR